MKKIILDSAIVAIITGAGSGMGAQSAVQLANRGARLVLIDRNAEALESVRQLIHNQNRDVTILSYPADVTDVAALENIKAQVLAEFGYSNLLINCAGSSMLGSFDELTLDEFEWLMNINIWGTIRPTKVFLPLLKRGVSNGGAHIANLSSAYALVAPAGRVPYATSKYAVRGFSESLRHELARIGISVTVVHPGGISTGLVARARVAEAADPQVIERVTRAQLAEYGTSAESAARQIIVGITKRKKRVLIGRDAKGLDLIGRLAPTNYWRLLQKRLAAATETV